MENSFQTSFIPKKPIIDSDLIHKRKSSVDLFTVLSVIILLVTCASAVGLFFYKKYLSTQINGLSSSIIKTQGNFDQGTIDELSLFDKRSSTANIILSNHVVLSPIFKLIADNTILTVQYTKFDHETIGNEFQVTMSGIASDYRSVALQADVFNNMQNRSFKNVVFSNILKDKTNYVTFDVTFDVDRSLIAYANNLVAPVQPQTMPTTTPSQLTPTTPTNTTTTPQLTTPNSSNSLQ